MHFDNFRLQVRLWYQSFISYNKESKKNLVTNIKFKFVYNFFFYIIGYRLAGNCPTEKVWTESHLAHVHPDFRLVPFYK